MKNTQHDKILKERIAEHKRATTRPFWQTEMFWIGLMGAIVGPGGFWAAFHFNLKAVESLQGWDWRVLAVLSWVLMMIVAKTVIGFDKPTLRDFEAIELLKDEFKPDAEKKGD